MDGKNIRFVRLGFLLVLFLGSVFFASCSSHSEGSSLPSRLDQIDAFIQSGDTGEALKLLKQASKEAFSSYSRLGVYKRYMILGEKQSAEKVLVKGLKKLPDDEELSAVYAGFLLDEGRVLEAAKVSKCLKGTSYGSLYSEAVLRLVYAKEATVDEALAVPKKIKRNKKNPAPVLDADTFKQYDLVPIYADAYKAASDWRWLADAVTICMLQGQYENAVSLRPQKLNGADENLLWSLVLYDAGLYAESLDVLYKARSSLSASVTGVEDLASYLELCALLSDVYYILGSDDASENERKELLLRLEGVNDALLPKNFTQSVLPLVYLNSISHARSQDNPVGEYALLEQALEKYPSNRYVLAAFGQFALDTAERPLEDELLQQLRAAGLKTQGMEYNDSIPRVALDEALSYIDLSLDNQKDVSLIVLREELNDAVSLSDRQELKASRVWLLLEQEETGENSYPDEVLSYALSRLISQGYLNDARELFYRCLTQTFGKDFDASLNPEVLDLWQAEYAAYFEGTLGNARKSRALYSYIEQNFADRAAVTHSAGQNESVVNALVNLALIEASSGEEQKAIETLNRASGKTYSTKTKAEILYRLAVLHHGTGDDRNALRSLQYALSLNPSLGKARLLEKEIK